MTNEEKPRRWKFHENDIIEDDFEFVEASAYDALKAERDVLRLEIQTANEDQLKHKRFNTALRAKLEIAVDALNELYIPYSVMGPGDKMPRFPDVIIRKALEQIGEE